MHPWVLVCGIVLGVENRVGTTTIVTCQLDAATHIGRHMRHRREIKPTRRDTLIIRRERFPSGPIHPEHMFEVLSVITVGMNGWAGHVHPGQSSSNHVDAGLLKHFSG
jgi:hypothetical protein